MSSAFWLAQAQGIATTLGLSPEAALIFMAFIIDIFLTIAVMGAFSKNDHQHEIGLGAFIGIWLLYVFIDILSWYMFIVPVILIFVVYVWSSDK